MEKKTAKDEFPLFTVVTVLLFLITLLITPAARDFVFGELKAQPNPSFLGNSSSRGGE